MLHLHYLDNSRAHRILWLLEELGAAYEVTVYQRGPDMRAPEALQALHPLGKSPLLQDGDRILAESGAIAEYLLDHYGAGSGLRPAPGSEAALRQTYWLHYAEGSAMPLLFAKLLFAQVPPRLPFPLRPLGRMIVNGVNKALLGPELRRHAAYWEAELTRDGWFAGTDFSVADIMMSFPIEAGLDRIPVTPAPPALARYLAAIRARPAYQRALASGGRYRYSGSHD
ncbi:glutathione S-transferase family protein [Loktanella agnita]|uniref:glutathione S-transferase family protein n=1 Tax=Loktanella agnita TaxID=287097 RepID=UPI003986B7B9